MQRARTIRNTKTRERSVLDATLAASAPAPKPIEGVLIGTVVRLDATGQPVIDFPYEWFTEHIPARTTVALDATAVGRQVAVVFEAGRPTHPVILGLLQQPDTVAPPTERRELELDGERMVFTAQREIVLRCGKASITLTKDGKILLRGEHLVSRSSGVNRIRGGSIHLN